MGDLETQVALLSQRQDTMEKFLERLEPKVDKVLGSISELSYSDKSMRKSIDVQGEMVLVNRDGILENTKFRVKIENFWKAFVFLVTTNIGISLFQLAKITGLI